MKIQVVRCDGRHETIHLIGTITVGEPALNGQGFLRIEETGTTHYFRAEDGAYDGWGMEISETGGELDLNDVAQFVSAVEKCREIHETREGE
jgi:hypothetical protein